MERQVEWTLSNGAKATYTIVVLSNEIIQNMAVEGVGYIAANVEKLAVPQVIKNTTIVASIGDEIGITEETYNRIMEAIAEVAPKWLTEQDNDDDDYFKQAPSVGSCY